MSLLRNLRPVTASTPRPVITWDKAERIRRNKEIWDNESSIVHRLPLHYQNRYWMNLLRDAIPVHYRPPSVRLFWDPKRHCPIIGLQVPEADFGLWGGEGVVKGWREARPKTTKKILPRYWVPRFWFPNVRDVVLYSEVLDRHMRVNVTERALRLIDAHFGLDLYLLQTAEIDLRSRLGSRLKRQVLMALARGDYHPEDEERREYIRDKYKQFVMPLEQAEWVGLELNEACKKQQDMEDNARPEPFRSRLERELVLRIARRQDLATEEEPFLPRKRRAIAEGGGGGGRGLLTRVMGR